VVAPFTFLMFVFGTARLDGMLVSA